jgi:hypothetical protein
MEPLVKKGTLRSVDRALRDKGRSRREIGFGGGIVIHSDRGVVHARRQQEDQRENGESDDPENPQHESF